jgi:hypothetical protein
MCGFEICANTQKYRFGINVVIGLKALGCKPQVTGCLSKRRWLVACGLKPVAKIELSYD